MLNAKCVMSSVTAQAVERACPNCSAAFKVAGIEVYLLTHTVRIGSHSPYYRNSEGYSGYVFGGESPVAANIYRYVVNRF